VAAPELNSTPRPQTGLRRLPAGLPTAFLDSYAAVWVITLAAAAAVALAGPALAEPVRSLLGLGLAAQRNPPPHLGHIIALAAHNIPIAAWPLLLGLIGAGRQRLARHLADTVVLACILANAVPVGAALGAYGSAVIAYIPQLPLEWAGLALGYASWLVQRERELTAGERLAWLALIAAVMLLAGTLESLAVPHR
jgi:hypothetical protein